MVINVDSFSAAQGRLGDARDFVKRVCKKTEARGLATRCKLLVPMNGNREKIITIVEFESMEMFVEYEKRFWEEVWGEFRGEWDWNMAAEGTFERYQYTVAE